MASSGWQWSLVYLCLMCRGLGDPRCIELAMLAPLVSDRTAISEVNTVLEATFVLEAR